MSIGWPVIPGVPAAGHISRQGYWHPGSAGACRKPPCRPRDCNDPRHDHAAWRTCERDDCCDPRDER